MLVSSWGTSDTLAMKERIMDDELSVFISGLFIVYICRETENVQHFFMLNIKEGGHGFLDGEPVGELLQNMYDV